MKILHVVMFCCFSVVCVEASAVLEVSGHVGGQVSVHCSGRWTTDNSSEHSNMYFCKEVCSRENILIQTERRRSAVTRRGRYSVKVNRGAFNVTIKRLKRADAGRYHCGVGETFNVYQEVNLIVLDASTVPPGSPPSTTTLQTEAQTQPQGGSPSSTEPSPAALTPSPPTEEKTNKQAAARLTEEAEFPQSAVSVKNTTVVIIVSVSLALLVCAIIPLIFYGHCRTTVEGLNRPEGNKGEADYCEGNADIASTQAAVRLQSLEPTAQDAFQYAAIYQALDPKSQD